MDAYRRPDEYVVHVDLPGVDPSAIDVTVDNGSLMVSTEWSWQPDEDIRVLTAERPQGRFTGELFVGDGVDTDHIEAEYDKGVLTVRVPVSEHHATVRKVHIGSTDQNRTELSSSSI